MKNEIAEFKELAIKSKPYRISSRRILSNVYKQNTEAKEKLKGLMVEDVNFALEELNEHKVLKSEKKDYIKHYTLTAIGHEIINTNSTYCEFLKNKKALEEANQKRLEQLDKLNELSEKDLTNSVNYYNNRKKRRVIDVSITILITVATAIIINCINDLFF